MSHSAACAVVLDGILAVADKLAAADTGFVHTEFVAVVAAAADTVVDIVAAVGISVVAHNIAVLDIADTDVGFVGACLHPYKHAPLLRPAYKSVPSSFQSLAHFPLESLGGEVLHVLQIFHPSLDAAGQTSLHPFPWFLANIPSLFDCSSSSLFQGDPCPSLLLAHPSYCWH